MSRLWFLVVLGCSEPVTIIELEVVSPDQLVLDELVVTIADQPHVLAMTERVQLLVPDAWAGSPHAIAIDGTAASVVLAHGEIVVVPIAGETVHERVTLLEPSCPETCIAGDERCQGDAIVRCEIIDGCPVWSEPEPCPTSQPFCSDAVCAATCSDECTAGATSCDGTASQRTCGSFDTDSCLEWGPETACPSGQTCRDGGCQAAPCTQTCTATLVVDFEEDVEDMVVDGDYLYWTSWSENAVRRRHKTTGLVETLANTLDQVLHPSSLAVDATHVYWVQETSTGSMRLMRWAKIDGELDLLDQSAGIADVAVDGTHVYWTNTAAILRRPTPSGTESIFTQVDALGVALDATQVYFTQLTLDRIARSAKANGALLTLATSENASAKIAVDENYVYWATTGTGRAFRRRAKNGGGLVETIDTASDLGAIAFDATSFYYTYGDRVRVRAKTGGPIRTIATAGWAYALAVDADSIYYSDIEDGQIWRLPRCACTP